MPQPIAPAAEIQVARSLDGSVAMPALDFSPDGSLLYVRQPVRKPAAWEYAAWYAPNIATVLLPITLLVVLIALRRVFRSPREQGKVYCRKCNYRLTPPLVEREASGRVIAPDGARCPECGSPLARTRPVIGRSAAARLWPIWGAAVPLALACLIAFALSLEAPTPAGAAAAWPPKEVQTTLMRLGLGSLSWQRRHRPRWVGRINRITCYEMPSGKRHGAAWDVDTHGFNNGRLAADGDVYLSVVQDPGNSTLSLLGIGTRTGARRSAAIAPWGGGADMLGLSPDGESVYVQVVTSRQSAAGAPVPWTNVVSLREFNARTLESVEIAALDRPSQMGPGGWETPFHRYVVDAIAGPARWALVSGYRDATGVPTHMDVTFFDGKESREFTVPAAGTGWHEPKLLDGGATLEINHYGVPMPPATRLNLATGAQSTSPSTLATTLGRSQNGRWRMVAGVKYLEIVDAHSGRVVACTTAPATSAMGVVSEDGRHAACAMWNGLTSGSPTFVVGVWEIPTPKEPEDGDKPPAP